MRGFRLPSARRATQNPGETPVPKWGGHLADLDQWAYETAKEMRASYAALRGDRCSICSQSPVPPTPEGVA